MSIEISPLYVKGKWDRLLFPSRLILNPVGYVRMLLVNDKSA